MIRIASYVTVTIWLVGSASCQDLVSPCPDIFKYEPTIEEDYAKRWYGVISVQTTDSLYGLSVDIVLTSKADSLGNWYGRVTTSDNTEFSIQNSQYRLEAGKLLEIRIFAQYRDADNVPIVQAIRLNGIEICSRAAATRPDAALAAVTAQPPRSAHLNVSETPIVANPTFVRTRPKDKLAWTQQCTETEVNPLLIGGKITSEGQWPWHVAIYHNEHEGSSSSIRYNCGGSLISDSHVLTAAHCLVNLNTGGPFEIGGINIYLGTRNIKTFTEGVQFRLIDKLEIHREYNSQTQYKDIAVLRLNSPAVFTINVKPVCLWPSDAVDLTNVVDKYGSVVGWGNDEYGLLADELLLGELPVVSELTCLRSHPFYQKYTNSFTFCAGLLQGTAVCNGDSGGGMVFKLRTNSGREEWFLRGIVSFSPVANNTLLCDLSRYAVFTDVAKYLDWIKDAVSRDM